MIVVAKRHLAMIAIAAMAIACASCKTGDTSTDSGDPDGITANRLTEAGNPPSPLPTPPKTLVMAFESVTIQYPGENWNAVKKDDLEASFTSGDERVTASVSPGYVPLNIYVDQVFAGMKFNETTVEGFDKASVYIDSIPDSGDVLFILLASRLLESGVHVQLQMTGQLLPDSDFLKVYKVTHDKTKEIPWIFTPDGQAWFEENEHTPGNDGLVDNTPSSIESLIPHP